MPYVFRFGVIRLNMDCKKCGGNMDISQISDNDFIAECDECGYMID